MVSSAIDPYFYTESKPLALELNLPWYDDPEQEARLRRSIIRALILALLFLIAVQFLPVFDLEFENDEEIVKTVVMLEPKKPVVKEEPKPKAPAPKPKVVKEKPKPRAPKLAQTKTPKKAVPKAEKKSVVVEQGLNDLSSQLSALTGSLDLNRMRTKNVTDSKLGSSARNRTETLGRDAVTRRSGGIEISDNDMKTNTTVLAAHQSTEVEGLELGAGGALGTTDEYGAVQLGGRDMESIRRTLESAKSRIYSVYQRALADDPDIAGRFIFEFVILPNGSISKLKLVSSELGDVALNDRILDQIRRVNFGQDDSIATPVEYKFDFI